jgi:hypothetical protein
VLVLKKWLLLLLTSLLLVGCVEINVNNSKNEQKPPQPNVEEQTVSLLDYFPNELIEKQFQGIGNEFAQYTETIYEKDGDYYPAIVDNGGTRILRIYRVTDKEISLVHEQPEFYEDTIPSIASLESAFQDKPLLTLPLEIGRMMGDWKLVSLSETVTVPFGTFSDVIVLEKTNEDGSINRQYWVEEYGKVKDEYSQKDENGNVFEVKSELDTIKHKTRQ